ncbi:MAG: hypothetical protein ACJATA_001890 [Sphingobacteriales bacterium]
MVFSVKVNAQQLVEFKKVNSFTNQELREELNNLNMKSLPPSSVTGADVYEFSYFVEFEMVEVSKFT